MQAKVKEIISILLVVILMFMNSSTVISYAADSIMSSQQIESQGTSTNNSNVEFDVYYDGGLHSNVSDISKTDTKINLKVNVKNSGYLNNITVDFSNANFKLVNDGIVRPGVQSINTDSNTVTLNQINSGKETDVSLTIIPDIENTVSQDMFNKDSSISLLGQYINDQAKEIDISAKKTIHQEWNGNATELLKQEITKYIPFVDNNENKLMVQSKITSGIDKNLLPVKETKLQVAVPKINNTLPEKVVASANTTVGTNGQTNGLGFETNNYNYDATSGNLTITVDNNADSNGKIAWSKNASDEYLVTYIYSTDVLNAVKDAGTTVALNSTAQIALYNNVDTTVAATQTDNVSLKDPIGHIVETSESMTSSICNGYMINNKIASDENKKETDYSVSYGVKVGYAEIIDQIVINQNIDQFMSGLNQNPTTVSGNNYAYDKSVVLAKNEFDKILGTDGTIIISKDESTVATINKDTPVDNNGNLIADISGSNANSIKITMSKPKIEGSLNITINKTIAKNNDYTASQIQSFDSLKSTANVQALHANEVIESQDLSNTAKLTKTTEKAELVFNNTNLSTVTKNTNIEIKAVLKTNSIDDKLYKNPTITIHLPSSFQEVDIKNVQLLFSDELTIASNKLITNSDGSKNIKIVLNGTQTKYCSAAEIGTTVLITTDITINKLSPSKDEEITMNYTNENDQTTRMLLAASTISNDTNTTSTKISLVAPTGVITTNAVSNYATNSSTVMSISGDVQEAKLSVGSSTQTAEFEMNVTNNYANTIDNVVVLGRTPFKGNKDMEKSADLGTTMTLNLASSLAVLGPDASKVTAYYSNNENATQDLTDSSNGWKSINDIKFEDIKSYMIVIKDYTMNQGDTFSFAYKANIPANLQYNQAAYENYVVYFNNNQQTGTIQDKTYAPKVGVNTGKGPIIEENLTSNIDSNTVVQSGHYIKYTVTMKNTGTEDATNVVATMNKPEKDDAIAAQQSSQESNVKTKYITSFIDSIDLQTGEYTISKDDTHTLNIGTIKVGETATKDFYLLIDYVASNVNTITAKATVTADKLASSVSQSATNQVKNSIFRMSAYSSTQHARYGLTEGGEYTYTVVISLANGVKYNTDTQKQEDIAVDNITANISLPEGLTYKEANIQKANGETVKDGINYDNKTRTISVNVGTLSGSATDTINVTSTVDSLPTGLYTRDYSTVTKVEANGVEETSDPVIDNFSKGGIKSEYTSSIPAGSKISGGDDLIYKLAITNLGKSDANINIEDQLPNGVTYEETTYKINDTQNSNYSVDTNNKVVIPLVIPEGQTAYVEIRVMANQSDQDITITNKPVVTCENNPTEDLKEISHTIEATNYGGSTNTDPNGNPISSTGKIQGIVWDDSNKDGIKDDSEEKIANIQVMLYNPTANNLVTDSQGNPITVTTGTDGTYEFKNLAKGKYIVIFIYDSAKYSPTQYKVKEVSEDKNSDATQNKIVLNGETKVAAVTDNIQLGDQNIYNIDLGLIENPKFDFKLDKVISKVTVKSPKENTVHDYNKNFAKLDLVGKYINETTLIVEYKITVTNEGSVPGYAKKVADYLPEGMKFNSELNKDWYVTNGTAYNASLANTMINPGENKDMTLVLTKTMSNNALGLINNTAEIFEESNDLGIVDVDSTPGNKASNEDDMSSANLLTSIKTGQVFIDTTLIVAVLIIVGYSIYMIKKKILK